LLADSQGLSDALVNTDKNDFSPRVGFAWRLGGDDKTVLRGGFGIFHPTVAVQGVRDLLATNEFRYTNTRRGITLTHGFSTGAPFTDPGDYGSEGVDPNIQSPDIYQYNLTLERTRPGPERRLHPGPLQQQRPGLGQQQPGRRPVRRLRHREGSRSGSERGEAPDRGQRHLGHPRGPRPQARRQHAGMGERALRGLDG